MLKLIIVLCLSPNISALDRRTVNQHTMLRNGQLKHPLRIIDGHDVTNSKYPFVVVLFQINTSYKHHIARGCTASMMVKNWILTAAHCVDYLRTEKFYVWYGNYTVPPLKSKLFTLVLDIFIHPAYHIIEAEPLETLIVDNDISLLRVDDIYMQSYGKLSSVDHTTLIGLAVTFVGGGSTNKPGDDQIRHLQVGEAAIITCDMKFRDSTKFLICVTPKCSNRMHTSSIGDSGGPLIYDNKIIGVLSYGASDGFIVMDGYAPVSPYIDWIYEVTHLN